MNQKTIISIFIILVIIGLAAAGYLKAVPSAEDQTGNQPRIKITPELYDFGEIEYGQVVKYTFKVKNIGTEILEIKKTATSCGCTTANLKSKISNLKSGEEADLIVSYDTGAMSGSHAKGKQERIIYVKTNDPIRPQAEVVIRALVK